MPLKLVTVDIRYENDVVIARQKARTIAAALNFDTRDQTRIATAVSEIARNAFQYAGGGKAEFSITDAPQNMLLVAIRDTGEGIPNLDHILKGKYTSPTGMGKGLTGANRLMDHLRVDTVLGRGTTVMLGKMLPAGFSHLAEAELNRLLATLTRSPGNPYEELREQNKELLSALDELRSKQSELVQLNRELDETNRGVVALYAELNDKAAFLQRASEMKSHFLSNMSHEFRTPLNSILALTQILVDRLDGDLTSEQEKQVKFVRNAANSLSELVNDLLDIAKVEAGKVTIRPTNFTAETLFGALRGMLRPLLIQNSSVALIFEDPVTIPSLYTDEAKVSQILRNFISNALKFTERGEIRVSAAQGHDDTVVFSVADTGIGISLEDQERIFQEWAQVEGKLQKSTKGSGLGLPLSRKLAQLLGGNVYVKSQQGIGSTFIVALPVSFNGATEVIYVPEVKRELDASKLPVLVVEDNREALFIYEKYLKGSIFQVFPSKTLKEARIALRESDPVAVILDVLLEGEQSWELLQELKSDPATQFLPVFVITVVDNQQKALSLGADAFHTKPVDRSWLLRQLEAIRTDSRMSRRVLVVDDDEASRYVVKTALAGGGFRLIEAVSGSQGLRLAREAKPDLIILDLTMPDLSGFEVLDKLKTDADTARIPVIIHTSRELSKDDREFLIPAIGVVPKRGHSREMIRASFAEVFAMAGVGFRAEDEVKRGRHRIAMSPEQLKAKG
jgi:signal transduction histidine kinase/CheY-like chemotaxis protein